MIELLGTIGLSSPMAAFAVTHLMASASPGPNFFLISGIAGTSSRKMALTAACGTCFSVVVWSSVAAIGLASLIEAVPVAAASAKYAGAGYMIWLGAVMLRSGLRRPAAPATVLQRRPDPTAVQAVRRGFLVGISNPATLAYYTSAFSLVVPQQSSPPAILRIVVIAVFVSALWWCVVAVLFSLDSVRWRMLGAQRALDVTVGTVFISFGVGFALG